MSLINLFVAARDVLAERRERRRAYEELSALDDRSLADIGLHRSQIPALTEGLQEAVQLEAVPAAVLPPTNRREPTLPANRHTLRGI
jgi:uncharacterized protein YjiS (DUF1127 family)